MDSNTNSNWELPTKIIQALIQNRYLAAYLMRSKLLNLQFGARSPIVRDLPARLIAFGAFRTPCPNLI